MLPFIADLPPRIQERVVCSISASAKYNVPANILIGIAEKEGGKPGQWVENANGTHDVGPMQFNTGYLATLKKYGITPADVAAAGCYSYDLAAWRIHGHLKNDKGDIWTRAANYHSRTPQYNEIYRADLIRRSIKWANWIEKHYRTVDILSKNYQPMPPSQSQPVPTQPMASVPIKPVAKPAPVASAPLPPYTPRQISVRNTQF